MSSINKYPKQFVDEFDKLRKAHENKENDPNDPNDPNNENISKMFKRFFVWLVKLKIQPENPVFNDDMAFHFIKVYEGLDEKAGKMYLKEQLQNLFEGKIKIFKNSLYYSFIDYLAEEKSDNSYYWKEIENSHQIFDDIMKHYCE